MANLTGKSIGRYHILEQLGEGGMATVYKAYDTRLERNVAFKVLRTDQFIPAQLQMVLLRFEREAKSLAKLKHPNIVNILDFGEHEGMPFLVMEYLPGGTLKQKLGQAVPWRKAIRILLPVARGLAYAHQHGVIHRDVKPANILIDQNEEPILTDFGIAKLLEGTEGHTLTGSGVGIGTPEYMAPEQGIGAHTIDARADIYSLGVVLYEMVTGRKPYIADTPMAVVIKHINDPLPRPTDFVPDLPEGVEQILFKALAKQPEDRYEDMNTLTAALEGALAEEVKTGISVPAKRLKRGVMRGFKPASKLIVAVIGSTVVILAIAFGLPWITEKFSPKITQPAPAPTNFSTPGWITDFSEPILTAINDRTPDLQDDFSVDTHQWYGCGDIPCPIIENGVMCLENDSSVSNYYFLHKPNIVLQMDILPPIPSGTAITLASKNFDPLEPLKFVLDPQNLWMVLLHNESINSGTYQSDGRKIQFMYIVKSSRVAFYIDETPVFHLYYPTLSDDTENARYLQCSDHCCFDNVKFWNLDNIPLPASPSYGYTSNPKPTETPQPTPTSTSFPAWVTDFAEPILASISNRPPTFEDVFEEQSEDWALWSGYHDASPTKKYKFENGKLIISAWPVYRRGFQFDDYVVEVDAQFVPGSSSSYFKITFRDNNCSFSLSNEAYMKAGCWQGDNYISNIEGIVNNSSNNTFHLRLIVIGSRFAFYVNEIPMGYFEYDLVKTGNAMFSVDKGFGRVDNFKVWDITNLDIP